MTALYYELVQFFLGKTFIKVSFKTFGVFCKEQLEVIRNNSYLFETPVASLFSHMSDVLRQTIIKL